MTDVNKIKLVSDRVQQAQSLLLSQFKDKPNILALVDSLVTEVQKIENSIIDLQNVRTLEGSYGVWLDEIGKRHKVMRGNYDDNDYKNAIKLAASKRTSSASVDSILRIVTLLTNDTDAYISNNYPYLQELYSYMFCLDQSPEGIIELGKLFPVNSRVRIIQTNELPFMTGTVGQGIGQGLLTNLLYTKDGVASDPRFTSVGQAIIPPFVNVPVANTSPPFITGDALIGAVLTVSIGLWTGDEPITYTYQWYRNGVVIAGATAPTFTLTGADANTQISCLVKGDNGFSNQSVSTAPISVPNTPIVVSDIQEDCGLHPFILSQVFNASQEVVTATITFTKDGMVNYTTMSAAGYPSTTLATLPWHKTPATDVGANYTVGYEISGNGSILDKAPSIDFALTTNQTFTASRNIVNGIFTTSYNFTIRKVSDASVSQTAPTTISLENLFNGIPN